MIRRMTAALAALFILTGLGPANAQETETFITIASTTSTQNSGLFDHILPQFTAISGVNVRVVAVGTGQAIRMAQNGDADVLFVHHRTSEEHFVADGYGIERFDVMYNDFVLVGPKDDPANIHDASDATDALKRIAGMETPFVSRGDDSGTNKKERELWRTADVDTETVSGTWYRELGSGMGATLNAAAGMGAYTLADRGTWLSFQNRQDLTILSQGDERLFNPYGVILVNPTKHPHVKAVAGQLFIDWLISPDGQNAIADLTIDGQQLFFPNAAMNKANG